ncbi:MAG: PEP-CTERM sorting domain-containing protein [Akkermansiaceae bacterium]|nr:PEP-CTERM sorting domain-containing protein [Akkermansiaceae bacterium]
MKLKTLIIAAISLGATALSQAFTLDFNALVSANVVALGDTVTSGTPLTVNVAGYGDVRFEVGGTDVVEVGNSYANDSGTVKTSLEMDPGDTVLVTFLGPDALNVDFDIVGLTPGEEVVQITQHAIRTFEFQVNTIGNPGSDGAGIAAISWTSVPEPSSAILGMLGAGALVLRRRR